MEPDQAAVDLLAGAVDELVEDMKRKAESGLLSAAESLCAGIVDGLNRARDTQADDILSMAPEFPGEQADYVVGEFLRACHSGTRKTAQKSLLATLAKRVPEWTEELMRAAVRAARK